MIRIPSLRWWIVGMLFLAAVLNYLDKQVMALLSVTIQCDLGFDDRAYATVTSCFLVAYAISLLIAGRLMDRIGVRLGLALYVGWWSLSSMAHAGARSVTSLAACQACLGFGEAGNWPASTKVVSEWVPTGERAFAIGCYTIGATLGATFAPLIITNLAGGGTNWRMAFLVTGAVGIAWILPWLWLYRRPAEHPHITAEELALTQGIAPCPIASSPGECTLSPWLAVLRRREIWLLLVGRMCTDPVWIFFQVWFPKYLVRDRGFAQQDLGIIWLVFLAADIGCLLGGVLPAWFLRRGASAPAARMRALLLCALLPPLSALIPYASDTGWCLALVMTVVFAHLMWLTNISALLIDVVPQHLVGTAFGLVAAGSTFGSVLMNQGIGQLVGRASGQAQVYTPWLLIAACLHPLVWVMLWLGRIERIDSNP
jgi:MFS transporter, ACS family, hexuronate transporter